LGYPLLFVKLSQVNPYHDDTHHRLNPQLQIYIVLSSYFLFDVCSKKIWPGK